MVDFAQPSSGRGASRSPVDLPTEHFRAFVAELMRACEAARACRDSDVAMVAKDISRRLLEVIELQTLEAQRLGGQSAADTEACARYLKASLADEWLLNLDWSGRSAWRHVLLEATLFNTSVAGDRVFNDIEAMLAAREPSQRPAARLYLHTLSLGFQGRHRDSSSAERLASYRNELFQFIHQRGPSLAGKDRVLSEQAYASTLSHMTAQRLPRLSRWVVVGAVVLMLLLGLSELLWLWQSWPVRRIVDATESISETREPVSLAGFRGTWGSLC